MSDSLRPHGLQHARPPFPSQLPEFTQTQDHWVGDAIQPSHLLLSSSPPAFNLSQHQAVFQRVSCLHQVGKVLKFQLQHQSFKWIFRTDFLQDELVASPCSPRDSQVSSPTLQFKSINSLALWFLYSPTLTSIHERKEKWKWKWSRVWLFATPWTVASRLLCPWDSPGKSGVGCHFLLKGIFLTQGSNPGLPHCRQTLYPLSHQRSPLSIHGYWKNHNFDCTDLCWQSNVSAF